MKRLLATIFTVVATCLAFAPDARAANTWGTDYSDMWWLPSESGWGANIAHQREVVFMTLYVYGPDSRMRWYAATNMQSRGGVSASVFDGDLYEFAGPYFGAVAFNPQSVNARRTGSATLAFDSVSQGTLNYSIDGVQISKTIQRQTFRDNNLSGSYVGSQSSTVSGCGATNGIRVDGGATVVSHAPDNVVSITTSLNGAATCVYSGNYLQNGRLGEITGSVTCSEGANGSFYMSEIEAGYLGYIGRFATSFGGSCSESGTMAWLTR